MAFTNARGYELSTERRILSTVGVSNDSTRLLEATRELIGIFGAWLAVQHDQLCGLNTPGYNHSTPESWMAYLYWLKQEVLMAQNAVKIALGTHEAVLYKCLESQCWKQAWIDETPDQTGERSPQ